MSGRFGTPQVVDLDEAAAELRGRRRALRDRSGKKVRKSGPLPIPRSALWVAVFYAVLAACTALWWHWDEVGLPRLVMGTLLLFAVLLAIGRELVWIYPAWMLLLPAAIVVAAFFYYALAPTAAVLVLVFIVNVLWFG